MCDVKPNSVQQRAESGILSSHVAGSRQEALAEVGFLGATYPGSPGQSKERECSRGRDGDRNNLDRPVGAEGGVPVML